MAALRSVGLDVGPAVPAAPTISTWTALVNDLTSAAGSPDSGWALVLDDYHAIEAPEVHEAVTFLLEHLPGAVHLHRPGLHRDPAARHPRRTAPG